MDVRKDDISRVLMDSQDERLLVSKNPPFFFDPLALLKFVQAYTRAMRCRILRHGATAEIERKSQCER